MKLNDAADESLWGGEDTLEFYVARVNRFPAYRLQHVLVSRALLAEEQLANNDRLTPPAHLFGYEVVLSDGKSLKKALLAPRCNLEVEQCDVKPGMLIRIAEHQMVYDECSFHPVGVPLMLSVEFLEPPSPAPSFDQLDFTSPQEHPERSGTPLLGGAFFYLPLHQDDHTRIPLRQPEPIPEEMMLSPVSLSEWLSEPTKHREDPPVLVGRVLAVSDVVNFSTSHQKPHRCPFKTELILGDGRASLKVVLWNTRALQYVDRVAVNMIVAVEQFRFKQYQGQYELSVNSKNPTGRVIPIEEGEVELPRWTPCVYQVDEVQQLMQDQKFDFCGVVTFVGKPYRRWQGGDAGRWSAYQWLVLRQPLVPHGISVRLSLNYRRAALRDVDVDTVVLLTNLCVHHIRSEGEGEERNDANFHASSTYFTELHHNAAVVELSQEVDELADILRSLHQEQQQGHEYSRLPFSYSTSYHMPVRVASLQSLFPALTLTRDVSPLAGRLHLHQEHSVLANVFVADVSLRGLQLRLSESGGHEREEEQECAQLVFRLQGLNGEGEVHAVASRSANGFLDPVPGSLLEEVHRAEPTALRGAPEPLLQLFSLLPFSMLHSAPQPCARLVSLLQASHGLRLADVEDTVHSLLHQMRVLGTRRVAAQAWLSVCREQCRRVHQATEVYLMALRWLPSSS